MVAIEQFETGNFSVKSDINSIAIHSRIVKSHLGWRVMSNNSARKNSRTHSATAEEAAKKYFNKKVTFIYLKDSL